jgi:hypothetical protein
LWSVSVLSLAAPFSHQFKEEHLHTSIKTRKLARCD